VRSRFRECETHTVVEEYDFRCASEFLDEFNGERSGCFACRAESKEAEAEEGEAK
jgi:hypothetical protein